MWAPRARELKRIIQNAWEKLHQGQPYLTFMQPNVFARRSFSDLNQPAV